ncbi:hypothetical protein V8D89_002950 [Ganoderma adspersum]
MRGCTRCAIRMASSASSSQRRWAIYRLRHVVDPALGSLELIQRPTGDLEGAPGGAGCVGDVKFTRAEHQNVHTPRIWPPRGAPSPPYPGSGATGRDRDRDVIVCGPCLRMSDGSSGVASGLPVALYAHSFGARKDVRSIARRRGSQVSWLAHNEVKLVAARLDASGENRSPCGSHMRPSGAGTKTRGVRKPFAAKRIARTRVWSAVDSESEWSFDGDLAAGRGESRGRTRSREASCGALILMAVCDRARQ